MSQADSMTETESSLVLRNHFNAVCPVCGGTLQDVTGVERDAGWFYYCTRFECDRDRYSMTTTIEEFNAIESNIGQELSEVLASENATVKLDMHLMVVRDLISDGVENYLLDKIEQRKNRFGEYIITRSLTDGSIDGLSVYFCKLAREYAAKYEMRKQAIAMKFAIDYLESTCFSDHEMILHIMKDQVEANEIVSMLIETCRKAGYLAKAKRIQAEIQISIN